MSSFQSTCWAVDFLPKVLSNRVSSNSNSSSSLPLINNCHLGFKKKELFKIFMFSGLLKVRTFLNLSIGGMSTMKMRMSSKLLISNKYLRRKILFEKHYCSDMAEIRIRTDSSRSTIGPKDRNKNREKKQRRNTKNKRK